MQSVTSVQNNTVTLPHMKHCTCHQNIISTDFNTFIMNTVYTVAMAHI
jgi:hypothetical protein